MQIEGTRASFSDLLVHEAKVEYKNIPDDVKGIIKYVDSMNYGVKRLKSLRLSLRLIKELHKILLTDTRGTLKNTGEFRLS